MASRLFTFTLSARLWSLLVAVVCVTLFSAQDIRMADRGIAPSMTAMMASNALSAQDEYAYHAIFEAQEKGDFAEADRLIATITDQRLLGTVLADRYLSTKYSSSNEELSLWLQNFADHPEAERITSLARSKGSNTQTLADKDKALTGIGRVDTIGGADMPQTWYHALSLWRAGQFASAAQSFETVGNSKHLSSWQRAAGYYWQGRTLQKLERDDAAEDAFTRAANYHLTFYGMLANNTLDTPLRLSAQAPYVPADLRKNGGFLRASALSQLGEFTRAEAEMRHLYRSLDARDRSALITLASEINLPNLQVRLSRMKDLSEEEKIFATYPMPQWLSSNQLTLDAALVYAISRQESSFSAEARSHAGATGLMQLMPSTARYMWKKSGEDVMASLGDVPVSSSTATLAMNDLHDPRANLLLGQEYVQYLMKQPRIQNNLVHILSGYNAGPGMVSIWGKSARNLSDPLLYIESIPYGETRNYVMQVLANFWAYQTLMGQSTDSLDALTEGQWPELPRA